MGFLSYFKESIYQMDDYDNISSNPYFKEGFQIDALNANKFRRINFIKERLFFKCFLFGIISFILFSLLAILKIPWIPFVFMGIFLICFLTMIMNFLFLPSTYCSKCRHKMKKRVGSPKNVRNAIIYLVCERCKLYIDTGMSSGD